MHFWMKLSGVKINQMWLVFVHKCKECTKAPTNARLRLPSRLCTLKIANCYLCNDAADLFRI